MANIGGLVTNNQAILAGGIETILSGGVVTGIPNSGTGISGGTVRVLSGGEFDHGTILSGGVLNVSAGASVHDITSVST